MDPWARAAFENGLTMPLTQAQKDAAVADAVKLFEDVASWENDVPERTPVLAAIPLSKIQAANVPGPAPTIVPDPIIVFDVPLNQGSSGSIGSTTSGYIYTPSHPWRNAGGDWIDADGIAQGSAPFHSVPVRVGQTGRIDLDVTRLIRAGEQPQICLRHRSATASAPTIALNSRESGAATAPFLTYGPGGEIHYPLADVQCNKSTVYELGGNPTTTLGTGSISYLRFPEPPAGATVATLTLNLVAVRDASGFVAAYDGSYRPDPAPPETYTLKGDPRIFFETQCFEDAPGYMKAILFGDAAHSYAIDKYHQRNIVVDETGEKVLQITFDPAVNAGATTSILFPNQDEADEAACEFDIRFLPDMETGMVQGFKCAFGWSSSTKNDDAYFAGWNKIKPGRCGTLLAGNGGAKSHGYDGWSMRFDAFRPVTPAGHPLYQHVVPMQYVYWPGQSDYYGDSWPWTLCGFSPKLNEWHTITQRAKINSLNADGSFNRDAELDGYLDGHLALRRRGFHLRTTDRPLISLPPYNVESRLAIGRIWLNIYHGGTALPRSRCSLQIRNFRAAKFA